MTFKAEFPETQDEELEADLEEEELDEERSPLEDWDEDNAEEYEEDWEDEEGWEDDEEGDLDTRLTARAMIQEELDAMDEAEEVEDEPWLEARRQLVCDNPRSFI